MINLLEKINSYVWGVPTLVLILGVGIYLSIKTKFVQLTLLPRSIGLFLKKIINRKEKTDGVTPVQALCTALAATVGTGNLAGVAGAIAIGGPGAVFWMWVCAFFGMIIKYAEATLSVRYRVRDTSGEVLSGPMYVISNGMGKKWKWLAAIYSLFGLIAAFGVGNATQINTLIRSVNDALGAYGVYMGTKWNLLIGVGIALLIAIMLLGGAKGIGRFAERLVPFAAALYLLLCCTVLALRMDHVPYAFVSILRGALAPGAVTGGVVGSLIQTIQIGTSRGIFTNEAGMGTAGIAHGAADVSHPAEQGVLGIFEVFLDTVVICTMTALVILCSGIIIPYGIDTGIQLTNMAFNSVLGRWVSLPMTLSVCCFALATVMGWGLYGARCAQYLLGNKVWKPFIIVQVATVILGAVLETGTVWMLAEIVNGLMAIPNLIALAYMSPELFRLTREFKQTH